MHETLRLTLIGRVFRDLDPRPRTPRNQFFPEPIPWSIVIYLAGITYQVSTTLIMILKVIGMQNLLFISLGKAKLCDFQAKIIYIYQLIRQV